MYKCKQMSWAPPVSQVAAMTVVEESQQENLLSRSSWLLAVWTLRATSYHQWYTRAWPDNSLLCAWIQLDIVKSCELTISRRQCLVSTFCYIFNNYGTAVDTATGRGVCRVYLQRNHPAEPAKRGQRCSCSDAKLLCCYQFCEDQVCGIVTFVDGNVTSFKSDPHLRFNAK